MAQTFPIIQTVCLRYYTEKAVTNVVTASFSMWTSLGLNLGPPDYESRKVMFHEILLFVITPDYQCFTKLSSSLNLKKHP
jgi:hypothetical protein